MKEFKQIESRLETLKALSKLEDLIPSPEHFNVNNDLEKTKRDLAVFIALRIPSVKLS